ncbi:lipoprotein LppI [Mycobacterium tuberculosis H1856]|nr:lipoprotein LppI [Mycobacterium tuberculosis H1856]
MRIAALVAVSLLIAGCSREVGGDVGQSQTIAPPAPAPSAAPSTPPAAGAPITTIVSWIEAGHPVDPAAYHVATRDGVTTQLGDDVAFSASSGTVACMTDARHTSGTLACLVRLANPPPRPETAYGEWKGGWVDFDGIHLRSGPPAPTRARSSTAMDPSWPTGTRCRSGTTAAAPIKRACSA